MKERSGSNKDVRQLVKIEYITDDEDTQEVQVYTGQFFNFFTWKNQQRRYEMFSRALIKWIYSISALTKITSSGQSRDLQHRSGSFRICVQRMLSSGPVSELAFQSRPYGYRISSKHHQSCPNVWIMWSCVLSFEPWLWLLRIIYRVCSPSETIVHHTCVDLYWSKSFSGAYKMFKYLVN